MMNLMRDIDGKLTAPRAALLCSVVFRPVHISVDFLFTMTQGGKIFISAFLKRGN